MSEFPRDPDAFDITKHYQQKGRERDFDWYQTTVAIEQGEVSTDHPSDDFITGRHLLYTVEFPGPDFHIIVDTELMNYVTGYWDDTQGAEEGALVI